MKKALVLYCLMASAVTAPLALNAVDEQKIVIVSFKNCIENSKIGKDERTRFEALKKELETAMEAKEKELNDLAPKFTQEYLDTLTPEAENELKTKFRVLSQELSQDQSQFYQMLNQANAQIMQRINEMVGEASKQIAKNKGYKLVVNDEACFFFDDALDISKDVIAELDLMYKSEKEKIAKEQEKQAKKN